MKESRIIIIISIIMMVSLIPMLYLLQLFGINQELSINIITNLWGYSWFSYSDMSILYG